MHKLTLLVVFASLGMTALPQVDRNQFGELGQIAQKYRDADLTVAEFNMLAEWPPISDHETLLPRSSLVAEVTCIDQRFRPNKEMDSVETVNKFRVDEVILGNYFSPRAGSSPPPGVRRLWPLQQDEILVVTQGGALKINGVLLRFLSNSPRFQVGQRYLLFLGRLTDRHSDHYGPPEAPFFSPAHGPASCLRIETEVGRDILVSLAGDRDRGLEEKFNSDKSRFKAHVKSLQRRN